MMPPDELDSYAEANTKIIGLLEDLEFTPQQCMVVMTMLTCNLFQVFDDDKDMFMKKISEIWDIVK
jgi:hypothetical protein